MTARTVARRSFVVAAGIALSVGTLSLGMSAASASTIETGKFQLCAQGDYPVAGTIESVDLGNGEQSGVSRTLTVRPGECTLFDGPSTFGRTAPVKVTGFADGGEFVVGWNGWNSSEGLGLGAQGNAGQHELWSW
jgi:hypothetical protein